MISLVRIRSLNKIKYVPAINVTRKLSALNNKRDYVEVRIPVPWGHIAGKWWGPYDKRPILGIHGWLDNAGTFDRLAPMLPDNVGFLAVDIIGHGASSPYPPGMYYFLYDGVLSLRRIKDYFNWPKVSFLGHSVGSSLSFIFSSLYPKEVDFLVGIDALKPPDTLPGGHDGLLAKVFSKFLEYDGIMNKNSTVSYSLEECIDYVRKASFSYVSKECAPYLLKRVLKNSPDQPGKYHLVRDLRLKSAALPGLLHDDYVTYASKITAPIMNIKSSDSVFAEDSEIYSNIINILKKKNKNVKHIDVVGNHYVHLEQPERIYEDINDFILKHDIEDRSQGGLRPDIVVNKIDYLI